jgi:translation initiation factor IF-3
VPIDKALQMAVDRGVDLVEVASTASPPVCRILDYGKYRYEQTKKERKVRSGQKSGLLKEIRVRPQVKDHDLNIKINKAKKFIEDGDKVKVFVVFRGRQLVHPELGLRVLQKVAKDLKGIGHLDSQPVLDGRIMHLILSPISAKQTQVKDAKEDQEVKEIKVKEKV